MPNDCGSVICEAFRGDTDTRTPHPCRNHLPTRHVKKSEINSKFLNDTMSVPVSAGTVVELTAQPVIIDDPASEGYALVHCSMTRCVA